LRTATSKAVSGFSTKQSGGEKPLSAAASEKTSLPGNQPCVIVCIVWQP
jgi:hypothetical protein